MNKKIDDNSEGASPPLPAAAVFDEQHLAEAKPVQPLRNRQAGRLASAFQERVGQRVARMALMFAGIILCVGIGAASVDWNQSPLSTQEDHAQAASESLVPS